MYRFWERERLHVIFQGGASRSFDGIPFASAEPLRLKYGERMRIVLVNDTMMQHPIHLHGVWSDLENDKGELLVRRHTIPVQPAQRISFLTTPHTHDVDGQTSSSESSHTHTVPSHSHSVGDHTHPMSYGIYLGPAAGSPAFTITINGTDRTAALGGPWNGDINVDITPYLVDANGHVLRQVNSVVIGAAQLCDVEMTVRSLVSATSIVPV